MNIELNEINGKPEIKITGEIEEITKFCDNLMEEGYSIHVEKSINKKYFPNSKESIWED